MPNFFKTAEQSVGKLFNKTATGIKAVEKAPVLEKLIGRSISSMEPGMKGFVTSEGKVLTSEGSEIISHKGLLERHGLKFAGELERGGVRFAVGTGTSFVQTEGHFNQGLIDRVNKVINQLPVDRVQFEHLSIPSMGGSFEYTGSVKQVLGQIRGFGEGAESREKDFIAGAAANRVKKAIVIQQAEDISKAVMKSGEGNDNSTMLKRRLNSTSGSRKTSSAL